MVIEIEMENDEMEDKIVERIEDLPNVIVVKSAARKLTEAELLEKLANEARNRQRRRFGEPKGGK